MKYEIIRFRLGPVVALILALSLISTSCGSNDCDPDKLPIARSAFAIQDGPAARMANDISAGVGKVVAAGNGREDRMVIAFEETHTSRAGQIEIAIMLLRLYQKHNLRQVSLEGAIVGDEALSPTWFHALTTDQDSKRAGERQAVGMLKDGEINCGEFLSLVLPDVQVKGNEKAEEYNVDLSETASKGLNNCLIDIAEKSLSQSTISRINQLVRENKHEEAADLLFGSDPWVRERYDKLTDRTNVMSIEESIKIIKEIEPRADATKVTLRPEDKSGLQDVIKFYKTASQRSCTMTTNTFAICDESPTNPVGFIIGAAHTPRVIELLKAGDASFAVVSPLSLANSLEKGSLTMDGFKRKNAKKSVDPKGYLGAYLDRRHKPGVVIGQPWYEIKSEIGILATMLAALARSGGTPPFPGLEDMLAKFKYIKVDSSSFELIKKDKEVWAICNLKVFDGDRELDLSIGGANLPPQPPGPNDPTPTNPDDERNPDNEHDQVKRLEIMLLAELARAREENRAYKDPPDPGSAVVSRLTTDTKVAIALSTDSLKSVIVQ